MVVIDGQDRVLLLRHLTLGQGAFDAIWVPPGGGAEGDESPEEAALRELWEEVGLRDVRLGPCVWRRRLRMDLGEGLRDFDEHFFFCRIDSHEVGDHVNVDSAEAAMVTASRWWTADEIEASSEYFAPRELGRLLRPLLAGDFPAEPPVIVE